MKLLIFHLSDIHFRNKNNYTTDNVNAIINVLRPSMSEIEAVLIIISGDLAFSGKKQQYIQLRFFLMRIKRHICNTYNHS